MRLAEWAVRIATMRKWRESLRRQLSELQKGFVEASFSPWRCEWGPEERNANRAPNRKALAMPRRPSLNA